MSNAIATQRLDDFDDDSGIRTRIDVDRFIVGSTTADPAPVYFELMGKRVYLGVQFPMGIVVDDAWEDDMNAADVPECMVLSTYCWLSARAI